jgi:hypothetical protein
MSTVREHLGLLWLSRRALMTSNPHEDAAWAAVAAYFVRAHLDELIEIMGGADIEEWARKRAGEIPADFPYSIASQAATLDTQVDNTTASGSDPVEIVRDAVRQLAESPRRAGSSYVEGMVVGANMCLVRLERMMGRAPAQRTEGTQPSREAGPLLGFDREDLEAIADGLESGYAKGVDVGGSPLDGVAVNLIESTTAAAARFIRAALAQQDASQAPLTDEQIDTIARKYVGMGGVEDYRAFARDIADHASAPSRKGALLNGETLANMLPPDATTIETPDGLKVCMTYKQLRKFAEVARAQQS